MRQKVTAARRRFRAACHAANGTGQRRADIAATVSARTGVPVAALDTWPGVPFRPTASYRRRGELLRASVGPDIAAAYYAAILAEVRAANLEVIR